MQTQTLNGAWEFRSVTPHRTPAHLDVWRPAAAPGGVHTDLLAAGLIPDPFVADNEKRVMWVPDSDWEYRRIFRVDDGLWSETHVFLVCEGLDTLAEVSLNGQPVGRTDNMFCAYRWDVKGLLRPGANEITIVFRSPTRFCAEREAARRLTMIVGTLPGGSYLRKAPSHFGWDWGPQLPAVGIWRDIRLEGASIGRLADVRIRQRHADGRVELEVEVEVERWNDATLTMAVNVRAPAPGEQPPSEGGASAQRSSRSGEHALLSSVFADLPAAHSGSAAAATASVTIPIADPQLWWPNGLGPQPLYSLEIVLWHDGRARPGARAAPVVLHRRTFQIGLRTIELRQEPDAWGRTFTFVVNGVPIFAKGSNWIPADTFPTRITAQQMEDLLASAAAANHNMVRVWGGGYYEDERFYDLCDRFGILVWQDFMFACAIYPLDDPIFLANVREEVIQNVRRLRHHACLALWCGNNEMETAWVHWGWDTPDRRELKAADQRFFYDILPGWVRSEDPEHTYWPSSPSSGMPFEAPASHAAGDDHLWQVWHSLKPIRFYREQFPRFASEFGMQSLPSHATIAAFAAPDEWNMTSYVMEQHQRCVGGNAKLMAYLAQHYRMPADFASLVYLTQVMQAEAIRTGVEHWRRNRDRCSGALYWQLNDCWPVASWSSLEYDGRWKALHYASRRFYAPVLLSLEDDPGAARAGVFVTNDTTEPWRGEVRWSLETLGGESLDADTRPIEAAPLATTSVVVLDLGARLTGDLRRRAILVVELWQGGERRSLAVAAFCPDKHLMLERVHLTSQPLPLPGKREETSPLLRGEGAGGQVAFSLAGRSCARWVELSLEGADAVFSDNYFDLPAGRTVVVTCPLPTGWTPERALAALRVRSLWDTYTHG